MNILGMKWTPGAPKALVAGMAVRRQSTQIIELVGTHTTTDMTNTLMGDCSEWVQVIEGYALEWLGNTGAK